MSNNVMTETVVQQAIIDLLMRHPRVAWAMVVTTGQFKVKGGYITTGHYIGEDGKRMVGMSDIIGQLRDGRMFAIETKRPGETPTEEQYAFIGMVKRNNGVAGWADNVSTAKLIIEEKV